MNKKNNIKRIGIIFLIAIAIIGSYFISGTYAKYTSELKSKDDIDTAEWRFRINGLLIDSYEKASAEESFQFTLFNTVYDKTCGNGDGNLADNRIAPGTCGKFSVIVKNESEINANYSIAFEERQTNLPTNISRIPIEYSADNGETWSSDINDISLNPTLINRGETSQTFTIKWRWLYENGNDNNLAINDAIDTQIGFAANTGNYPNVKVIPTVTVTQTEV